LEYQRSPAHTQGALALLVHLRGSVELLDGILEEIPLSSKDSYGWIGLVWLEYNSMDASKEDITIIGSISSTNSKYIQGS
jgi:hypothetical protein